MRPGLIPALALASVVAVGLLMAAVWAFGGFDLLADRAAEAQRAFQGSMARTLRALKAGQPGAVATLLGICFAYGVAHAAGPGHGKAVIGGYGLARRVAARRLALLAVAASLAQAAAAVVLVYAGVFLFRLTREQVTDLADTSLQTVSAAAIAAIGAWLLVRGLRGLWRSFGARYDAHRQHSHDAGPCETCGHAHGPSPEDAERVHSLRDAVILIASIAIRPCTGALFLLILTWRLGLDAAGIAGAFAMAFGTATVTVAFALASVLTREGALMAVTEGRGARVLVPVLELTAGLAVAAIGVQLVLRGM